VSTSSCFPSVLAPFWVAKRPLIVKEARRKCPISGGNAALQRQGSPLVPVGCAVPAKPPRGFWALVRLPVPVSQYETTARPRQLWGTAWNRRRRRTRERVSGELVSSSHKTQEQEVNEPRVAVRPPKTAGKILKKRPAITEAKNLVDPIAILLDSASVFESSLRCLLPQTSFCSFLPGRSHNFPNQRTVQQGSPMHSTNQPRIRDTDITLD
jgi:hypothetical protein